ncbi:MAG: glycosyltransferase involved in cell wall biosynthesis [Alcanivorax sp.]
MARINDCDTVIVTPVYEDKEACFRLFQELAALGMDKMYVVAVDDGSVESPLDFSLLVRAGLCGTIITLKRNVGHQQAIAVGLSFVAENIADVKKILVMDSDGEDLPSSIASLLSSLESEDIDIVVAKRRHRFETFQFRVFYLFYRYLFRILSGRDINFGNFMAMKPTAMQRLVQMPELWIHVAGCVLSSKVRINRCALDRGPRYAGHSKMSFVSLALHGFKGLMVFAEDVLVRVGISCSVVAALAVLGSAAALILKIIGFATPGWFSTALGILFMVFLQTGTLTLMTLMLTGVVKNTNVRVPDLADFVADIVNTSDKPS